MRREIRITGSGGQGIITAGYLLGKAASIYDGKISTQIQSYGPEARGGASKTEIIISDEDIYYPYIQMADIFISLSQEAYERYRRDVKKDAAIFIDPTFIRPEKNGCYSIPATEEAIKMGSQIMANIIMLGAAAQITGVVSIESLQKSIRSTINERFLEMNINALLKGCELGKRALEENTIKATASD